MTKLMNILLIGIMIALSNPVLEAKDDDKDVAIILVAKERVQLQRKNNKYKAKRGIRLHSGDKVKTYDGSLAALIFTDDKSQLKVRANSEVTIKGERKKQGILKRLSLGFGEIWAKVTKQKGDFKVETPSGVATVKGTEFNALFDNINQNFFILCREGLMDLTNDAGSMQLRPNEIAVMVRGVPPRRINRNPDEIFQLSGDDGGPELEIEFQDEDGNSKSLILQFDGN